MMTIRILPASGRVSNLSVAGVELSDNGLTISEIDVISSFDAKGNLMPPRVCFPRQIQATADVIAAILDAYESSKADQ